MNVDDSASGKNKTPVMSMATSFANNEPPPLAGFLEASIELPLYLHRSSSLVASSLTATPPPRDPEAASPATFPIARIPPSPSSSPSANCSFARIGRERIVHLASLIFHFLIPRGSHPHPQIGWVAARSSSNAWTSFIAATAEASLVFPFKLRLFNYSSDAQSWYLLGRAYLAVQKHQKAYEACQQAVYRDGRNPTFWCSIGVLYYNINQYRDALDAYSRAIRINPYSPEVWFDLGSLYESCNNPISDAIDAYARVADLDPNNQVIKSRLRLLKDVQANGGTMPAAPEPQDVHPTAYTSGHGPPSLLMGAAGSGSSQAGHQPPPQHPHARSRSNSRLRPSNGVDHPMNGGATRDLPAPSLSMRDGRRSTEYARHPADEPFHGGAPLPLNIDGSAPRRGSGGHAPLAPMDVDRRDDSRRYPPPDGRDRSTNGPPPPPLHHPVPQTPIHGISDLAPPPPSARDALPSMNSRAPYDPHDGPRGRRSPPEESPSGGSRRPAISPLPSTPYNHQSAPYSRSSLSNYPLTPQGLPPPITSAHHALPYDRGTATSTAAKEVHEPLWRGGMPGTIRGTACSIDLKDSVCPHLRRTALRHRNVMASHLAEKVGTVIVMLPSVYKTSPPPWTTTHSNSGTMTPSVPRLPPTCSSEDCNGEGTEREDGRGGAAAALMGLVAGNGRPGPLPPTRSGPNGRLKTWAKLHGFARKEVGRCERALPPNLPIPEHAVKMGKIPGSTAPKVTRKASKEASAGSAQRAQHILESSLKKSHLSENTLKSYRQQFNAAKQWLRDLQLDAGATEGLLLAGDQARDAGDNAQEENEDGDTEKYDPLQDPDVRLAFEKPIRATPYLIAMYIAWIVFEKERSKSTADSAYSAFKWAFSEMEDGRWKDPPWRPRQGSKGEYDGTPVSANRVSRLMKIIKKETIQRGDTRTHAAPLRIEQLDALVNYSMKEISLGTALKVEGPAETVRATKHLFFRAYITLGFVLWTRGFELGKLERRHVTLNRKVPGDQEHMRVHLEQRKGWTAKASKGESAEDLRGHYYNIYPSPPEGVVLDCVKHVSDWLLFAEAKLYERNRNPGSADLVFLNFHLTSGKVSWGKEMSTEAINSIFKEFMFASGVLTNSGPEGPERFPYTTHCLRRGGAQYRFMFAPVGQRWSLDLIKWWGGWTDGERIDTLIRYLLDDLSTYENDYSDALSPRKREPKKSLASEHLALQPVSQQDFQSANDQMFELLRATTEKVDVVLSLIHGRNIPTVLFIPSPSVSSDGIAATAHRSPADSTADVPNTTDIPLKATQGPVLTPVADARYLQNSQIPPSNALLIPRPPPPSSQVLLRVASTSQSSEHPSTLHATADPSAPDHAGNYPRIPNLPRRGAMPQWRRAVLDWLEGDPARNLDLPLKDWPGEWYAKGTGQDMLYFMRKTIAEAFIQCGEDEARFIELYPAAGKDRVAELHRQIREGVAKRRTSKNGSYDKRLQ
ncbi:hypothetical protein FRC01_007813 [Tulasnella sp. 417]|nr:hypothetical protein FRC01_007813 [Tulasnella sp. 417]